MAKKGSNSTDGEHRQDGAAIGSDRLTRRDALKSIAAAGALVGATGTAREATAKTDGERREPEGRDWLLCGTWVLPMNPSNDVIHDGAVAIRKGRIVAVGQASELKEAFPDLPRKDYKGHAILPGLVNTHCHTNSFLHKGMVCDIPVWESIYGFNRPNPLGPEEGRPEISRLGLLDVIKCGVTTNFELGSNQAEAEVHEPFGVRLVLSYTCSDSDPEVSTKVVGKRRWMPEWREPQLEAAADLVSKWHGKHDNRILCQIGGWAPDNVSLDFARQIAKLCDELGVGAQFHLGQGLQEIATCDKYHGMRPTEYLYEAGLLGPKFLAGHCVTIDDDEIRLLGETESNVGFAAFKHCQYSGLTRALPMQEAGANITLGTDDSGDYFTVIRSAMQLCRLQQGQRGHRIEPMQILRWATINGARVVGMQDEFGSLEVGKRADLITVNLTHLHNVPVTRVESTLVHYTHSTDVETVMVEGRMIMEDRHVYTADEDKIVREAVAVAEDIWSRAIERNGGEMIKGEPLPVLEEYAHWWGEALDDQGRIGAKPHPVLWDNSENVKWP